MASTLILRRYKEPHYVLFDPYRIMARLRSLGLYTFLLFLLSFRRAGRRQQLDLRHGIGTCDNDMDAICMVSLLLFLNK
ncbi:hypothetical protein [Sphingobacterium suaedae]|uniref:Uncharacterized protein n=1 Tax=Sphingobacterium suaedae TaxID=1686402 RepID=A0ABW5KHZ2_9SPHI